MRDLKELLTLNENINENENVVKEFENLKENFKEIFGFEANKDVISFLKNYVQKMAIKTIDDNLNIVRTELKDSLKDKKFLEIDLKQESLTKVLEQNFKDHSFNLLNNETTLPFKVKNIPTKTGYINSQNLFVKVKGNEIFIGNIVEKTTSQKRIDYPKLISEVKQNLEKYAGNKKEYFSNLILPVTHKEASTTFSLNTRNKLVKEKFLKPIYEVVDKLIPLYKNKFDLEELKLLLKVLENIKIQFTDINSINSEVKIFSVRNNKEKDTIYSNDLSLLVLACEKNGIKIPYKETKIDKTKPEKQIVVNLLNSKKIKNVQDITSIVNSIVKNIKDDNKSYQDIKITKTENINYLNDKKVKGISLIEKLKESKKNLTLNPNDKNTKNEFKRFEQLNSVQKYVKAVINDKVIKGTKELNTIKHSNIKEI